MWNREKQSLLEARTKALRKAEYKVEELTQENSALYDENKDLRFENEELKDKILDLENNIELLANNLDIKKEVINDRQINK